MSIEIIAEIAQGYEGNYKLAELLTIGSIRSGADSAAALSPRIFYGDYWMAIHLLYLIPCIAI